MDYKDRKYKRSKNYADSFKHAYTGIKTAVIEERNLRFHFCAAVVVIGLGFFYSITRTEWLVLVLCIFAVLVAEMTNTAIERAVDVATERFMEEAKKSQRYCCRLGIISIDLRRSCRINYFYSAYSAFFLTLF